MEDNLSGEQSFSKSFTNMAVLALPLTEGLPDGPSLHGEGAWRQEFVRTGDFSSTTISLDNPDFPTILVLFDHSYLKHQSVFFLLLVLTDLMLQVL